MGFVYYGSEESLMEGGVMSHLKDLAAFDRTNNPSEPIQFYVNTEPECKEKRSFAPNEPAVALYVHKDVLPFTL
jgi:hypothetical protein